MSVHPHSRSPSVCALTVFVSLSGIGGGTSQVWEGEEECTRALSRPSWPGVEVRMPPHAAGKIIPQAKELLASILIQIAGGALYSDSSVQRSSSKDSNPSPPPAFLIPASYTQPNTDVIHSKEVISVAVETATRPQSRLLNPHSDPQNPLSESSDSLAMVLATGGRAICYYSFHEPGGIWELLYWRLLSGSNGWLSRPDDSRTIHPDLLCGYILTSPALEDQHSPA
ncbi:hypothetical protein FB45DRAFT_1008106 [Roridomyces roridus]|uniref:Uncharacterized protein n=1 Tax=Roridomyces roridus TaxID=1738132 RepID=A0AAD7BBG7_9AGAR|nr:hypothetical protein FB45DRAFT_1008106 [Roridomyces roridus]